MSAAMMMVLMSLRPDQIELVHRFFDGELDARRHADVEALLRAEPEARRVLDRLRRIDRSARNELLAATAREDFTDWWAGVEQQMSTPSLEPPAGVAPIRGRALSIVPSEIARAASEEPDPRPARGWLIALAFSAAALGTAAAVLLSVLR